MDFYCIIPEPVGGMLFEYFWIILSIAGFTIAIIEFMNNRIFSIYLGGFAVLSALFGMVTDWIGSMYNSLYFL